MLFPLLLLPPFPLALGIFFESSPRHGGGSQSPDWQLASKAREPKRAPAASTTDATAHRGPTPPSLAPKPRHGEFLRSSAPHSAPSRRTERERPTHTYGPRSIHAPSFPRFALLTRATTDEQIATDTAGPKYDRAAGSQAPDRSSPLADITLLQP